MYHFVCTGLNEDRTPVSNGVRNSARFRSHSVDSQYSMGAQHNFGGEGTIRYTFEIRIEIDDGRRTNTLSNSPNHRIPIVACFAGGADMQSPQWTAAEYELQQHHSDVHSQDSNPPNISKVTF